MATLHRFIRYSVLGIVATGVILSRCTMVVTSQDIARLRIGMSPHQAIAYLDRTPSAEYRFDNEPHAPVFLLYQLRRADDRRYFLVFLNDSLRYWGYPEECAMSDLPGVAAAARQLQSRRTPKSRFEERISDRIEKDSPPPSGS